MKSSVNFNQIRIAPASYVASDLMQTNKKQIECWQYVESE